MYPAQYPPPPYPGQQPQQGYAPAPQQAAPVQMMAPGGAPQPVLMDPSVGGEPGPSIAELDGRCCLFIPRTIRRNQPDKYNPGQFKDEIITDIVVLDGPNLYYGAAPKANPPRPQPTHVTAVPAAFLNRIVNGVNVVGALERAVGTGAVVGVVRQGQGTKGSPPWNINAVDGSDPRRQLAVAYLNGQLQLHQGTEMNPTPQLPPNPYGQPAQQVPPQAYQQPAQMAPAPVSVLPNQWPGSPPIAPQPQPQQAQQPVYAPAPQPVPNGQPVAPAQPVWVPPAAPAPAAVAEPGPPPGYEAMWGQLTPEQRNQVLAHVAQQQQAAPQPAAPNPYS